jgi:hypothetical protein
MDVSERVKPNQTRYQFICYRPLEILTTPRRSAKPFPIELEGNRGQCSELDPETPSQGSEFTGECRLRINLSNARIARH